MPRFILGMVQETELELTLQCHSDLTAVLCGFATFCYYVSSTSFNISLVPQIHKNAYLRSTNGLSTLWAASLFTATLVHGFFIFHITDSIIYFKISSVIYSLSACIILVQLWMYSKQNIQLKLTIFGICMVIWVALLSVEFVVPQPDTSKTLEWIAVVLFSVDLLPQVMLNIMEYSTLGQSNIAVVLMTVGKTFQFVAMQIIRTPVKFKSMIYVGAFLGHINCLQLVLYRKPQANKVMSPKYGTESGGECSRDHVYRSTEVNKGADSTYDTESREEGRSPTSRTEGSHERVFIVQRSGEEDSGRSMTWTGMIKNMALWQLLVALFEIGALTSLTVITTAYIGFQWILFAPCVVFLILWGTALYRDFSGSSWEDAVHNVRYKLFSSNTL